ARTWRGKRRTVRANHPPACRTSTATGNTPSASATRIASPPATDSPVKTFCHRPPWTSAGRRAAVSPHTFRPLGGRSPARPRPTRQPPEPSPPRPGIGRAAGVRIRPAEGPPPRAPGSCRHGPPRAAHQRFRQPVYPPEERDAADELVQVGQELRGLGRVE